VLHWLLIANFVQGFLYAGYMLFFVVGGGGPLFRRALDTPAETLVLRRLYAIEAWVAIAGLAIYLGVTEILPRMIVVLREDQ
jgi:hypothetical protein